MGRPRRAPPPADRPAVASITSVAARAGVSIATVSRIVNGIANKAGPETIERVQRAIAELGYRPLSVGRALRRKESRLVALLAANLGNPAMAAIAASAETALREAGYVMVLCDTHDRPDLQDEYLLEMRAQLVRGIILLGAVPSPHLERFVLQGEPLLFVNRRSPFPGTAPFVGVDNALAGGEVASLFLSRGIHDIAVVHGSLKSSATAERLEAFVARLGEAGIRMPKSSRLTAPLLDHLAIGYAAGGELAAAGPMPRGIFCLSDLIAYGVHKRLMEAGVSVPAETLIVGFDDNPLNNWLAPWLSSVRVPYASFGDAIVDAFDGIWSGATPRHVELPHELMLRGP
jgi:LacI family transcriptional regulator